MTTSKPLSPADADAFGRELDALRAEVLADLGQADVDHIRRMIRLVRYTEVAGRVLLHFGIGPLTFALGVSALGASKILENMEVGHNVMHGQYDWSGDPALDSKSYEWDTACPAEDWRHSHNYEHHTFTNVLGRDRDVGYAFLRVNAAQPWRVHHLVQPISAAVLALLFQWGVGMHDLRINETLAGQQPVSELRRRARPFLRKAGWQLAKDYVAYPLLAVFNAPRVLAGNLIANGLRNLWTFGIIFCGHFPEGVQLYSAEQTSTESRGQWYVRQLNGSANIEGSHTLHVLSGHLSHQIEHHLFPDLPAARYPELAPKVRAICERYGQVYNTGSFAAQLGSVARQLVVNALPSGRNALRSVA
ncbi:MAG: acyl-CoA desaturase [Deltaproteobacteria bacterium]|nr:acyl-CoA desaturase [Deltaproteobacteria bacterium]